MVLIDFDIDFDLRNNFIWKYHLIYGDRLYNFHVKKIAKRSQISN